MILPIQALGVSRGIGSEESRRSPSGLVGLPHRDVVDRLGRIYHRYRMGMADAWPLTHCHALFLSTQTLVNRDFRSKGLPSLSRPASL